MAVKGDWAIKRAKKRRTDYLIGREGRLRNSFVRRGLEMNDTVELAAIRLVLAASCGPGSRYRRRLERQMKLEPVEGLPALL